MSDMSFRNFLTDYHVGTFQILIHFAEVIVRHITLFISSLGNNECFVNGVDHCKFGHRYVSLVIKHCYLILTFFYLEHAYK